MPRKPIETLAGRHVGRARSKRAVARSAAQSELRKSGIRAIGDMPWGTHICVFSRVSPIFSTRMLPTSPPD